MAAPHASSRPLIPGYGVPETTTDLLPWNHVEERMQAAQNFWIGTVAADGRPHGVPVQGAWVSGALYFGGGPDVLWQRNLRRDPRVSVHLESGDDVVIFEGRAEHVEPEAGLLKKIQAAYEKKYGYAHPPPFWTLLPNVAFAWTRFDTDPTRYRF